jgi:hypothetical protein
VRPIPRLLIPRLLLVPLALSAVPATAGEWETMRDSYDGAVKTYARRIAEIEARERAIADPDKRADKLTRDRIASIDASLKSGPRVRTLTEAADRGAADPKALAEVSQLLGEYLDGAGAEWRADGAERRKVRDALAALQRSLERAGTYLDRATEVAVAAKRRVPQSGVPAKIARIEAEAKAKATWQQDQAARDRERKERERQAAERERGVR